MRKIYVEVVPNPFNETGYVLILYTDFLWIFHREIGRIVDAEKMRKYIEARKIWDGAVYENGEWKK